MVVAATALTDAVATALAAVAVSAVDTALWKTAVDINSTLLVSDRQRG